MKVSVQYFKVTKYCSVSFILTNYATVYQDNQQSFIWPSYYISPFCELPISYEQANASRYSLNSSMDKKFQQEEILWTIFLPHHK